MRTISFIAVLTLAATPALAQIDQAAKSKAKAGATTGVQKSPGATVTNPAGDTAMKKGTAQKAPAGQGNPGQAGGGQWDKGTMKGAQKAPAGQGNPGQAGGGQWDKAGIKGEAAAKQKAAIK